MASPAFKFTDRRRWMGGANNELFKAARPDNRRRTFPRVDQDSRRNVSEYGRRELMSAARFLASNFGPIGDAIRQIVCYAVGPSFRIQYRGENRAWGEKMEEMIFQHDKICDVRGGDFVSTLKSELEGLIRDGDANFILTENAEGYPLYQSIPSHRLGVRGAFGIIDAGEYRERPIYNGVIVDPYGRPLAYRLYSDSSDDEDFKDVPAKDFGQVFRRDFVDQTGGLTWLAPAIQDVDDILQVREFTKTGLKGVASRIAIEHNEDGQAPTNPLTGGPTTASDPSQTDRSVPFVEKFEEGTMLYMRAAMGGKLEIPNDQRPSANAQEFSFEILRGAYAALGWPVEFYNPESIGGANIRLRVAQAMRTVETVQRLAECIATRKHAYAIAKFINLGVLEPDKDWWRFEHQKPRDLTVDNGRDTKADLTALESGALSLGEWFSLQGQDWQEQVDEMIAVEKYIQTEAKAAGVDPNRIRPPANRGGAPNQSQEPQPTEPMK